MLRTELRAGCTPESLGLIASSNRSANLVCGDVAVLTFLNNSFHLVTSIAALAHFDSVFDVVTEIRRVLRPGGVAWVCIHMFTSPSGGHNLSLTEIPLRSFPLRYRCLGSLEETTPAFSRAAE
jgi:ubiquinone/menaquinone biosynthesis C-methylase UbiE